MSHIRLHLRRWPCVILLLVRSHAALAALTLTLNRLDPTALNARLRPTVVVNGKSQAAITRDWKRCGQGFGGAALRRGAPSRMATTAYRTAGLPLAEWPSCTDTLREADRLGLEMSLNS